MVIVCSSLEKSLEMLFLLFLGEVSCYKTGCLSNIESVVTKMQQNHRESASLRTVPTNKEVFLCGL